MNFLKINLENSTKLLILFATLGLLFSSYLYYTSSFKDNVCGINSCNIVLKSKYSEFLGINNSLIGIFYFSLALFFSLFLSKISKIFQFLFIFLSFLGFIFSIYLILIQFLILKKICIFCIFADLSAILIFLILFYNLIKGRNLKVK